LPQIQKERRNKVREDEEGFDIKLLTLVKT
jgi:hypothetical protein